MMSNVQDINFSLLRKNMDASFSLSELNYQLCFDLDIDFEKIPGANKEGKIVELIRYCRRYGRVLDLLAACRQLRPNIQWSQDIAPSQSSLETVEARRLHRKQSYSQSRNIQMVHTIRPAVDERNWWEILIYLVRHGSEDLSIIDYAEFFMGSFWQNKIFRVSNQDNFVGITTFTYSPFVCTCRLVFTDGQETMLNRYIDFEMATLFTQNIIVDTERSLPPSLQQTNLIEEMMKTLRYADLEQICAEMNIDLNSLPGNDRRGKIRELIQYFQQDSLRLVKLIQMLTKLRPQVNWQAFLPDNINPVLDEEDIS